MKTLMISNGDLDIDTNRGQPNTIDGINKGSQDVARHLLSEYDSTFQEGNELLTLQLNGTSFGYSNSLVVQFLSECINRLIVIQRKSNATERIIKINQIRTSMSGQSTLVFMVEVLFQNGQVSAVVDQLNIKPTKLDQLLSPDAFLSI